MHSNREARHLYYPDLLPADFKKVFRFIWNGFPLHNENPPEAWLPYLQFAHTKDSFLFIFTFQHFLQLLAPVAVRMLHEMLD